MTDGLGKRARLAGQVLAVLTAAALLAVIAVSGLRMYSDIDELEDRLATTERQVEAAETKLDEVEDVVGDVAGAASGTDAGGLAERLGAVRGDQESLTARVTTLARELDSLRSETEEMSEFLDGPGLFASQGDLDAMGGCVAWIVDQIREMAYGYEPNSIPPNDCRWFR